MLYSRTLGVSRTNKLLDEALVRRRFGHRLYGISNLKIQEGELRVGSTDSGGLRFNSQSRHEDHNLEPPC